MKCNENEAKKIYLFSTTIIPENIPFPNHDVMAITNLGDGNCLFNSASFLLCRDYSLSASLRLLTAAELYLNADKYANHPKLLQCMEDLTLTYDPANLFSILLTDEVSSAQTTNKIDLVRLEAERTARKKTGRACSN